MLGPSPNGVDGRMQDAPPASVGRDVRGRFGAGNPGGPGNPLAGRVSAMRRAFADAVTDDDLQKIARALVSKAANGDVPAAREVLNRLVGDVAAALLEDRLVRLEAALNAGGRR